MNRAPSVGADRSVDGTRSPVADRFSVHMFLSSHVQQTCLDELLERRRNSASSQRGHSLLALEAAPHARMVAG